MNAFLDRFAGRHRLTPTLEAARRSALIDARWPAAPPSPQRPRPPTRSLVGDTPRSWFKRAPLHETMFILRHGNKAFRAARARGEI